MDLKTGFDQIRVKAEYIEKTAFNAKYDQFEYLVMPTESYNAPSTFQSLINGILYDCLGVFMVVHEDDLLILSRDEESDLRHRSIIFSLLKGHQLFVFPENINL